MKSTHEWNIRSFVETNVPSTQRNFGLDESFPPGEQQRWRSSVTSTDSLDKLESRLTTGDTGEISAPSSISVREDIFIFDSVGHRKRRVMFPHTIFSSRLCPA